MTAPRKKRKEPETEPAFEESLAELQQIVAELEDGSVGLEESMVRFEKGVSLLRGCFKTLEAAEQKIEVLTGISPEGDVQTAPFDASATVDEKSRKAGRRTRKSAKSSNDSEDSDDVEPQSDTTLF